MSIKKIQSLAVIVSAILFVPSMALAGADAEVYGCIHLPVRPVKPITYKFTAGAHGTHCMSQKGKSATLIVKSQDLSCASLGDVAEKTSSDCAEENHQWNVAFKAVQNADAGSAHVKWSSHSEKPNKVELLAADESTMICESEKLCSTKSLEWNKRASGPIYIIFQPSRTVTSKLKNLYHNIKHPEQASSHTDRAQNDRAQNENANKAHSDHASIHIHKNQNRSENNTDNNSHTVD